MSEKAASRTSVHDVVRRPSGFVAKCQCGVYVGALDIQRTDREDIGTIVGRWLFEGKTVEPRFGGAWEIILNSCRCKDG